MSSSKHITSHSGEPMLSARAAAARLGCAKDYVGKLLREGKLRGARIQGAWFVEESSIAAFEVARAEAKLARASSLAQERKLENAAYRKANGLPEKPEEAPSANAETPAVSTSIPAARIGLKSLLARNLAMVFGGVLLFCAVAYAGAMHQREVAAQKPNALAAALAQVESPFFGAHPIAFGVSLPQPASTSVARDIFSSVFSYLFGPRQMQYAGAPRAPQAPIAIVQPYGSAATSTIVYNTYPVVERAVGVAGGVTQEMLNERLLALQNYLLPKIDAAALSPKTSSRHRNSGGGGNGSVTSVDASGGATGLAFLGGPVTSTGAFTLSGVLNAMSGGTGTSTAPSYGQLLLGNASGGYDLVSTSTLGIAAGGNPSWGNIIGTLSDQTDLQNALDAKVSLSYLAGLDKGYFFSTTSAQYFLSTQSVTGFSTTSADYWKTQNSFFSTTSSNYAVGAYISASSTVPHVAGGTFGDLLLWDGTKWTAAATSTLGLGGSGGGSVTSVNASGGTTGLTFTGGPVTSSGTLVLGGMLGVTNGGTGTSTAPAYGQVLVGNGAGGYDLVSTSTLGIAAGTNPTGFSTTSADYWKTQNSFFSTTSAAYFLAQNQGNAFSTTSAQYFASFSGLLSTSSLSALAPLSYNSSTGVFSIQAANGSQDGYLAAADWSRFNGKLGTTSISGTYPVQYNQGTGAFSLAFGTTTANAWSQLQQFSLASTSKLSVYQNAYFGATATSTFSSTGALALAGGLTLGTITGSTQCLHVNAAGVVSGTGSDCGSGGGGGGATNFLDLTDTPDVYSAGQIFFTNQSEDALIGDNTFTFDGTTLNAPGAVFTTLTVLGSSNVGTVSTGVWHGSTITDAYVADSLTISGGTINNTPIGASVPSTAKFTNASSTNFFATSTRVLNSSTTLATIDALYINNLTGPLQAVGGLVSATSSIGVLYGGTGLTAAPSYGQVLVGNSAGGYDLVSTSSLGLLAPSSLSALAPLAYDASTGTFSISQASGSANGYLSSTDWNTFNNKISSTSLSGQSVISYNPSTGVIATQQGTFGGNASSVYTFPGQLVVTSSTSLNTFTFANATGTNATTTNLYAATASSTNLYATNSFFGSASINGLTISSLTGPLQAVNGVVSATTSVGVLYGGTGLTVAPSYGTILVGNSAGGYALTATNTLGLLGSTSISAAGPLSYNVSTGVFSIAQSGSSQNGYLSSADWT
ncbi:MAG TPA: hypothetical protein VHD37_02000, partial [Candidatus Paceibacterota bacterium]|nr:hypothetical protein [Candidatus Paceibacterota bacterium]